MIKYALSVQLHTFSPAATFSSVCSDAVFQHSCTLSPSLQPPSSALQFIGPAVLRQLTCNLSALMYPVTQSICIDSVSKLHLSFIIVSLGSCAVRASVKYSSTAALMTAGSSSRAGPGQPQLPISMARLTPQSSGSPAEACRGHPTCYLG